MWFGSAREITNIRQNLTKNIASDLYKTSHMVSNISDLIMTRTDGTKQDSQIDTHLFLQYKHLGHRYLQTWYWPPLFSEENMCWHVSWVSLALDGIFRDASSSLTLTSSVISTSTGSGSSKSQSQNSVPSAECMHAKYCQWSWTCTCILISFLYELMVEYNSVPVWWRGSHPLHSEHWTQD